MVLAAGGKGTTLENWMKDLAYEGECIFLSLFLILEKAFLGALQKEEVYLAEPRKGEPGEAGRMRAFVQASAWGLLLARLLWVFWSLCLSLLFPPAFSLSFDSVKTVHI